MSDQDHISDEHRADSISDDTIRRSLLGCADPDEQANFETLLLLDDQFAKRVYRLEFELADDFAFGRLSATEQQLFTSHFLVTHDRARELAVSQALRRAVSDKSFGLAGQTRLDWRSKVLSLFAVDRPLAKVALAASALLFFGTLFWLIFKAPTVRPTLITQQQPVNSKREYAHARGSQSPEDKSASDHGSAQTVIIASITLHPDSESKSKPTIHVANPRNEADHVRLELLLNGGEGATCRAILVSDGGVEVTSSSELSAESGNQPKIVLDVPASLLNTGNYYIELRRTSAAQTEPRQRYSFQVQKE